MILPIYVYGSTVLKKEAERISKDYPDLHKLIADMWDTLYHTEGVGLAAPQVGHSIQLLIIDATPFKETDANANNFKRVMINPEIIAFSDEKESFNEGCLSVPGIHEDVIRPKRIHIRYLDENLAAHEEWLDGVPARIAQHEYDHIAGILFTEYLAPIRRKILSGKLQNIAKGKGDACYKTKIA